MNSRPHGPWPLKSITHNKIPHVEHVYIIPPFHHVIVQMWTKVPCMLGMATDAKWFCLDWSHTIHTAFAGWGEDKVGLVIYAHKSVFVLKIAWMHCKDIMDFWSVFSALTCLCKLTNDSKIGDVSVEDEHDTPKKIALCSQISLSSDLQQCVLESWNASFKKGMARLWGLIHWCALIAGPNKWKSWLECSELNVQTPAVP